MTARGEKGRGVGSDVAKNLQGFWGGEGGGGGVIHSSFG